jgi:hypothetical protein
VNGRAGDESAMKGAGTWRHRLLAVVGLLLVVCAVLAGLIALLRLATVIAAAAVWRWKAVPEPRPANV